MSESRSAECDQHGYYCPFCESSDAPALVRDPNLTTLQAVLLCDAGHVVIYDDSRSLARHHDVAGDYQLVWDFSGKDEDVSTDH